MKKILNKVDDVLTESLQGFAHAHGDLISVNLDPMYVARKTPTQGKVAIVSGGGSGHEPMHVGYVGYGMLDAACPGQVFTSPTPDQILTAVEAVDTGAGVLFIVKNYAGDVMNFEMAAEMYSGESSSVLINDDVAVESSLHSQGRRGVAATVVVEKMVGAAAEKGASLNDCVALAERINAGSGSMGVALSSCTVPAAGTPTFELADDEMEFGVGIHGEPGRKRVKMMSADDMASAMVEAILESLSPRENEQFLLMVNGLGGTPLLELYGVHAAATQVIDRAGFNVSLSAVGNYCTSLEMAGCSLTLVKLDEELISLWNDPVHTAALRWGI